LAAYFVLLDCVSFCRYKEDDFLKKIREANFIERRLRKELKIKEDVLMNRSSIDVQSLNDLYRKQRDTQKKMFTLKEIQQSSSPAIRRSDQNEVSIKSLQDELQARQEEIALQIRKQMNKHRNQIEERQKQSEGKLKSLRQKVDDLDDLVSNTSNSRLRDDSTLLEESLNELPQKETESENRQPD